MDNFLSREHRAFPRSAHNEEFLNRLFQWRPQDRKRFERMLARHEIAAEVSREAASMTEEVQAACYTGHEDEFTMD